MAVHRIQVYSAIDTERDFQDKKWGTIEEHPHEVGSWLTIMRKLLSDAEQAYMGYSGDTLALEEIRKVVSVGVACMEQHGAPRRCEPEMNLEGYREAGSSMAE